MDVAADVVCGTEMHTHGTQNGENDADVEVELGILWRGRRGSGIGAGISSQAAFTDGTHGAKADAHGSKPDKADERYPRMDECLRPVAPMSKAKTSGTE